MSEEFPHYCEGSLPQDMYGPAIERCWTTDDGRMWAGNYEYLSQVAFCPYCGEEAPVKPEVEYLNEWEEAPENE